MGLTIFVSTLLNLLAMLAVWFGSLFFGGYDIHVVRAVFGAQVIFAVCALICTALHETRRKQGDTLFEEISDGLQLQLQLQSVPVVRGTDSLSEGNTMSVLKARLILRTFAQASDLPLVPGKFGAAIYVAVNLLLLFSEFLRFTRF